MNYDIFPNPLAALTKVMHWRKHRRLMLRARRAELERDLLLFRCERLERENQEMSDAMQAMQNMVAGVGAAHGAIATSHGYKPEQRR